MNLRELKIGESAVITAVGGEGALRQHFLDMGVLPGSEVTLMKYAPMGDPMQLDIHGYELTLRLADAEKIEISPLKEKTEQKELTKDEKHEINDTVHPGIGEGAKFSGLKHEIAHERFHKRHGRIRRNNDEAGTGYGHYIQRRQGQMVSGGEIKLLTFALVGNQNCGKTTLFNQLTGSNQHVGNFPGVTVDRKDGEIQGIPNSLITDLPGIYSLSPYTSEEIVSRKFILEDKPTGIINIVDATNIERNLYLTLQLMELQVPMVLALNMMDEVRNNGGTIKINALEEMLGIPVIPISAAKNEGVDELVEHAMNVAVYNEIPGRMDFCKADEHGGAIHRCIHGVMHLIEDHATEAGFPVRFAATKLIEGDELVKKSLNLTDNELKTIEHIVRQMEEESGFDRAAAIADMRFDFIKDLCRKCVIKPKQSKEHIRSERIDRILTGKATAIPSFILIMGLIFWLTFGVIGASLQHLLVVAINRLTQIVDTSFYALNVNSTLHSLVIDGVFAGVGSVVSFLPVIVTLFFFLSILEDSGYMARVAFVMDKILRRIGLSGRSIVPMLIGFGCSVPAVMSSRTLPSERDRKMTILMVPFMSCSAKLPIYAWFVDAFFENHKALIMIGLYLLGILFGVLFAVISKNTKFKGEAVPFVMELPNYRMPGMKNVLHLLWDKAKDFLQRAFSVIFIASIIVWLLQSFDFRMNLVSDSSNSMLAAIAGAIAPVFKPLGFGNWQVTTSLISGFMAKESVVSTLQVLFTSEALHSVLSPVSAASLLVFCLLYTPCVAAISSIRRELGGRWASAVVIGQCAIAWIAAFIVNIIGSFFI